MSIGTSVRRVLSDKIPVPRRHVRISSTIVAPNKIGAQAPSNNLRKLAEKNVTSTMTKGTITSSVCQSFHFHNFQITMNASSPSTTIVVATAMP